MPQQFCPISFTLFPSIKWEGKTYSILMHIRGTQTPHQVVLITASRPYRAVCQWPPSLDPMASGLCTPDKCCCHQPPKPLRPPPFIIPLLCSTHFLSSLSPVLHHLCPFLCPFSPPSFPPLLFPFISVPYSFPTVIRSWQPPTGVNRGENQPWVSGCISSLRCLPASNEGGRCQNPTSRCAMTHMRA